MLGHFIRFCCVRLTNEGEGRIQKPSHAISHPHFQTLDCGVQDLEQQSNRSHGTTKTLHGVERKTDFSQVLINLMVLLKLTFDKALTNGLVAVIARFIKLEWQQRSFAVRWRNLKNKNLCSYS